MLLIALESQCNRASIECFTLHQLEVCPDAEKCPLLRFTGHIRTQHPPTISTNLQSAGSNISIPTRTSRSSVRIEYP